MTTRLFWCLMAPAFLLGLFSLAGAAKQRESGGTPFAPRNDKSPDAAQEAIRQSARAFEAAFEKRDAKSIAALWTEDGEYQDAGGELIRGRGEIEKAFAEFFKENPQPKIGIVIESIRFPAAGLA